MPRTNLQWDDDGERGRTRVELPEDDLAEIFISRSGELERLKLKAPEGTSGGLGVFLADEDGDVIEEADPAAFRETSGSGQPTASVTFEEPWRVRRGQWLQIVSTNVGDVELQVTALLDPKGGGQ